MKMVFMGTSDFAVPVLRKLNSEGHDIDLVLTQPDRAGNRNKVTFSPVKEAAMELGLDIAQPVKLRDDSELLERLKTLAPDMIVVVAYGQILTREVLDIPRYGCFNVHASLLPRHRGASPMQHAILAGDEKTGVTIMKMNEGLDTGDMALKGDIEIGDKTFPEINEELSALGAELMQKAAEMQEEGTLSFVPQNDAESTYAGLIRKQDGKIDFSAPAVKVERMVRAFDPWPGTYCFLGDKQMKIWKASCGNAAGGSEGEVIDVSSDSFTVNCGGTELVVRELQMPGKKRVSAEDYLRGSKIEPGTLLK